MTVFQMLARNARKYPAQLAISDDQQELSWAQLAAQVEQLAAWLQQEYGVRPGDRVALVIPNSIAFVVGFFAIQRLDAIAVPVNVRLTTPELEYILGNAESELVLTSKMTDAALKPLVEQGLAALWLDDLSVSANAATDELQELPPTPPVLAFYFTPRARRDDQRESCSSNQQFIRSPP